MSERVRDVIRTGEGGTERKDKGTAEKTAVSGSPMLWNRREADVL